MIRECKSGSRSQVPAKQTVNKPGVNTGNKRMLKANTNTDRESTSESRCSSNNYNIDNFKMSMVTTSWVLGPE